MKTSFAVFLTSLLSASTLASELDVPNDFVAGTPAVAVEVNANFAAVEVAVNDNAARVAALETGLAGAGVSLTVDGNFVGRLVNIIPGSVEAGVAPIGSGATELVSRGNLLINAPLIQAVSATGYFFRIATSTIDGGRLNEGDLDTGIFFFDATDCTGNTFIPVEGPSGRFSTFTPGSGDLLPLKRWYVRQGVVFQSPDPNDANAAYMLRRSAVVVSTPLRSFLIWSVGQGSTFCVNMTNFPDYDPNDPLDVEHSAVPLEVWDPNLTGVPGRLGGELTIGL